jgi:hypothetical protein
MRPITDESRAYHREYMRKYRETHAEQLRERDTVQTKVRRRTDGGKYNEYMNAYRRRPENIPYRLLTEAKYRAGKRGLAFDITQDDVVVPEFCPVLGLEMRSCPNGGGPGDTSPTLDRIDSTKGYVKGNVWVISGRANRIKNNATLDELRALVAALALKMEAA